MSEANLALNSAAGATDATARTQYFNDFSSALRYWRDKRGYSQLRLSAESNISQRHLSFLESGRSQPSKEMILKLGTVLDIPLRQRNIMLLAAGFAPAYQERKLSDTELQSVKHALDFMLAQQAPYPALVVDRLWNLVMHNGPASAMIKWLLDMPDNQAIPREGVNIIRLMLDPSAIRQYLVNWEDVCADLLHWIQREAMSDGPGSEATDLLAELTDLPGVKAATKNANLDTKALPFLSMEIKKNDVTLKMFTTITTMGTPLDVTVHELRVESFFPADEKTAAWFQSRA
jgi:transcriptional regulator with XRE-family HTH domain